MNIGLVRFLSCDNLIARYENIIGQLLSHFLSPTDEIGAGGYGVASDVRQLRGVDVPFEGYDLSPTFLPTSRSQNSLILLYIAHIWQTVTDS